MEINEYGFFYCFLPCEVTEHIRVLTEINLKDNLKDNT